ncbi:DUF2946 family protein [Herminiimonas contaminans]|uniref:DUF2946 family protein n=1 Tax=Herminiimonas contaminans TaxID=1111140 RepID=A0ABS0EP01_9BURK|nr:DUF2946 family protein [Herminiimonas contaminans]MBF8176268.1 DUF2946 family protein [Herminiimonas contaminans]
MDAIVAQALAKWPNVPHCYGWLALDARGNWRMRNEAAQAQQLPGDKIAHPALISFIQRNYACDTQGRYYFQNGPQRVYVDLEIAPYIAHTDPAHGFVLHTGEPPNNISAAYLSATGRLFLHGDDKFAALDDRDMALCLPQIELGNLPIKDEELLAWLASEGKTGALSLQTNSGNISLQYIKDDEPATRFGFILQPRTAD